MSMRLVPCRLPGRPTQVHFVQMRGTTRTKANVGYKGCVFQRERLAPPAPVRKFSWSAMKLRTSVSSTFFQIVDGASLARRATWSIVAKVPVVEKPASPCAVSSVSPIIMQSHGLLLRCFEYLLRRLTAAEQTPSTPEFMFHIWRLLLSSDTAVE